MVEVLIADNDTQVNELLSSLLRMEGWQVHSVFDGQAALDFLRQNSIPLLVCDLDMPEMDGFSLVGQVSGLTRPPEVIVVTGFTDPVVREQLAARGPVRDVWIKPFDLDEFCVAVREVLEGTP